MSDFQATTTPAKYRFRIDSNLGNIVCDRDPNGWESGILEINRNLEVGGVFSQFNAGNLIFTGNAAELLNQLFDESEFNFNAFLVVEYLDNSDGNYKRLGNKLKIQPDTASPQVGVGKTAFGFQVQVKDSGIKTKLDKRQGKDVDLTKLVSIGGYNIIDFVDPKININYPEVNIQNMARWFDTASYAISSGIFQQYIAVPLVLRRSDYSETKSVEYATDIISLNNIGSFFDNALTTYTFDLTYVIETDVSSAAADDIFDVRIYETSSDGVTIINETELFKYGSTLESKIYSDKISITVQNGNKLKLAIYAEGMLVGGNSTIDNIELTIEDELISSPAATVEGLPIAKALKRCLQHNLDIQNPVFAPQFGTLDDIYKDDGTTYATEDQLTYCHIQSGLNLRGEPLSNINAPLAVSFEDLFNFCQVAYDSGYSITEENGIEQVKIDKYENFFNDTVVLDFSDKLTIYDIETTALPEVAYSGAETGFNDFEYKEVNGRGEPNTTAKRTTELLTEGTLNNVSKKVRGDSKGIFDNLAFTIQENATTDTESDTQIFATKSQKDGIEWKPESNENIEIEDNTSLFGESLLNRYYTPSRMLRRRRLLKTGLTKFPSSYVRFQVSDKLQTLKTTGTAQSGLDQYTITENEDILVDDLLDPIFGIRKHKATVPFTFDDLAAIQANPEGIVRLISGYEGYLVSLKKQNNKAEAEIEIIEKYVSS